MRPLRATTLASLTGPGRSGRETALLIAGYALIVIGVIVAATVPRRRRARDGFASALRLAAATRPRPAVLDRGPDAAPPTVGEPPRAARGHAATDLLEDPFTWAAVDAAVARTTSPAGDAWPYAMLIGPDDVRVLLAGSPPAGPPEPWRAVDGGWQAPRDPVIGARQSGRTGASRVSDSFVALGVDGDRVVLLDLARAPGCIAVTGDAAASRTLASSLAAQFEAVPGHRVLAADSALPGAPRAAALTALLDSLPFQGAGTPPTLLVCAVPTPVEAVRLRAALARDRRLRVLMLGEDGGSRWPLRVAADGVVTAALLGLAAASASLPQEVAPRRSRGRGLEPVPADGGPPRAAGASRAAFPADQASADSPPGSVREDAAPSTVPEDGPVSTLEDTLERHPALAPVPERKPEKVPGIDGRPPR